MVSLVVLCVMFVLVCSEVYEWRRLRFNYEFLVDQTVFFRLILA